VQTSELLDLSLFIASCANGLKTEPREYGPLRLIEVLSRLVEYEGRLHCDSYLSGIATDATKKAALVMTDQKAFDQYLEALVVDLVRERQRRLKPALEP